LRTSSRLLEDSKIEHDNVIWQLKEKLACLRHKSGKNFQGQTRDTYDSIDSHIHVVKTLFESYSDILPTLGKTFQESEDLPEFQFMPDTMNKIYMECKMPIPSDDSLDGLDQKQVNIASKITSPLTKPIEKKGFAWSLLSKITNSLDEPKPRSTKSQDSTISQEGNTSMSKNSTSSFGIEALKEWETEIFRPILGGIPAKEFDKKITQLIEKGNYVPSMKRGLLWRKLVSNRGRISRRLFKLLLGLLDKASPSVKDSIVKDMDRTYGEFKESPTYRDVKNESIKVLQLFDVAKRLISDS
jgi:hypothetical protein